jgi:hypothetical protein
MREKVLRRMSFLPRNRPSRLRPSQRRTTLEKPMTIAEAKAKLKIDIDKCHENGWFSLRNFLEMAEGELANYGHRTKLAAYEYTIKETEKTIQSLIAKFEKQYPEG